MLHIMLSQFICLHSSWAQTALHMHGHMTMPLSELCREAESELNKIPGPTDYNMTLYSTPLAKHIAGAANEHVRHAWGCAVRVSPTSKSDCRWKLCRRRFLDRCC